MVITVNFPGLSDYLVLVFGFQSLRAIGLLSSSCQAKAWNWTSLMSENDSPAVWPPVRRRMESSTASHTLNLSRGTNSASLSHTTQNGASSSPLQRNTTPFRRAPLSSVSDNGFEVKPQTPSYKPYALNSRGCCDMVYVIPFDYSLFNSRVHLRNLP